MELPLILACISTGAAVVAVLGVIFVNILPGPNKLRQDQADRIAAMEARVKDVEIKVASEHPVFLERLNQLGEKLGQNTIALERLGIEFNAFARNFRGANA